MSTPEEVNATAAAVTLAEANNVDLADVEGTGTDGKVTVDDVRAYIEDSGEEVIQPSQEAIDEARAGVEGEEPPVGPKPSEQYGTALDAEVGEPQEAGEELPPVLIAGYWVKLGSGGKIPEENEGDIAIIVESPWTPIPFAGDSEETVTGYRYDEDKPYLVRTRGSAEVNLIVESEDSFVATAPDRPTLLSYA